MTAEQALYQMLAEDKALNKLVGSRIYPLTLPDNADIKKTALIYQLISETPEEMLGGPQDLIPSRFQLTVFAPTYEKVKNISSRIKKIMQAQTGGFYENRQDKIHEDLKIFGEIIDVIFWHKEN